MEIKKIAKQRNAPADARDAYAPPKLKVFGPVGALTQGGSVGAVEMGMSMSSMMQRA